MKKFFYSLVAVLVIVNLLILVSGKFYLYKVIRYNLADIDDYKIFPQRIIQKSYHPQPWKIHPAASSNKVPPDVLETLKELGTVAVLIIKKNEIVYEAYWEGYNDRSISNSFSMSKSYVSALVGIALHEGKIKSLDQKVSEFLPEFSVGKKSEITLKNLLTMSSGLNWREEYMNPLSTVTEAYYGGDLRKLIDNLQVEKPPGKNFEYKGSDTQILAFILEKVYHTSLSKIAENKLWRPLGATDSAIWSLDKENGVEKASCCLNSTARDFARLGSLYLNNGNWKGQQLISTEYIQASVSPNLLPDADGDTVQHYGYQWWIIPEYKGEKIYYARGVGGQYIIINPSQEMVIVRLGRKRGKRVGKTFQEVYDLVDAGTKMK